MLGRVEREGERVGRREMGVIGTYGIMERGKKRGWEIGLMEKCIEMC